jgi:hypothetical protein
MPAPNGIKIPKSYKLLHPLDFESPRPDIMPEGLRSADRVKIIVRNGAHTLDRAGAFWWGDADYSNDQAIVAYRVINIKNPWVLWGAQYSLEDIGRRHYDTPPILETAPDAEILVWLRYSPRPQTFIRPAHSWNWELDGGNNDIMRYRLARSEDANLTRL